MKTKHTPGPWQVSKTKEGIGILAKYGNAYTVVIQERQLGNTGLKFKMELADAKLIASAPENLKEHFNCLELLRSIRPLIDPAVNPVMFAHITEQVNRSEKVIKKATI